MGLRFKDWVVYLACLLLAVFPDPTDVLDFGLPIFEPLLAVAYWYLFNRGGKKR